MVASVGRAGSHSGGRFGERVDSSLEVGLEVEEVAVSSAEQSGVEAVVKEVE